MTEYQDDGSDIAYYSTQQLLNELGRRTQHEYPPGDQSLQAIGVSLTCSLCGQTVSTATVVQPNVRMSIPLQHLHLKDGQDQPDLWPFVLVVSNG